MVDRSSTKKKNNSAKRARISKTPGPRKTHQKQKPTFSEPETFVTFAIGPKSKLYRVHKEVAINKCEAFAAAFSSNFEEGQTQTFKIEDTTEAAFRFLMQWLYFGNIEVEQLQGEWEHYFNHEVDGNEPIKKEWAAMGAEDQALAETWVLAEKYGLPALQNLVVRSIVKITALQRDQPTATFRYVYENTSTDSLLRRLCLVTLCAYGGIEEVKERANEFPSEMMIEFAAFMLHLHDLWDEEGWEKGIQSCLVPEP